MPVIRVETLIHAPQEVCFDMARDVGLHVKSTSGTGERIVAGKKSGLLELGDEITFEARHLGVRQRLTAKVVAFERPHAFTDVMLKGAFARMMHEHRFAATEAGTFMIDVVDFASPFGPLGALVDKLFLAGYMRRFIHLRGQMLKAEAEAL